MYEFFKNHLRRGVFRNANLSNLENVLQRNLRTGRGREFSCQVPSMVPFWVGCMYRMYVGCMYVCISMYVIKQNKNSKIKNINKIIYIIIASNHAKAIPFILSKPRLSIFLFCKFS